MVNKSKNITFHAVTLRIVFGIIWLIDAILKWLPGFNNGFMEEIKSAAQGQPDWLHWWFQFWIQLLSHNQQFFVIIIAVIESLIAIALLLGFARRTTYIASAIFSLLIWSVGEGFGGPYVSGSTDIGAAIIYVLVFYALYVLDQAVKENWSIDNYIIKKLPWWAFIANP